MEEGNTKYYELFRSVPEEAQSIIKGGKLAGKTDINPMWRIKRLTETFGPCGIGWYVTEEHWETEGDAEKAAFCKVSLFVKFPGTNTWSMPIIGIGGSKISGKGVGDGINDDAFKMAYTDGISIACKMLGMAADIYYNADVTKYGVVGHEKTKVVQSTNSKEKIDSGAKKAVKTADSAKPQSTASQIPYETVPKYIYEGLDMNEYWKYAKAQAAGIVTPKGRAAQLVWIEKHHPTMDQIAQFETDVLRVKNGEVE